MGKSQDEKEGKSGRGQWEVGYGVTFNFRGMVCLGRASLRR